MAHYFQLSESQVIQWLWERLPAHKPKGRDDFRGPCPLHLGHDDNFSVKPSTGEWYCHSQCCRGGHIVQLEAELCGKSIRDAITSICELVGKPLPNGGDRLIELETYDYTDENGALLFQQVRCWDATKGEKTFLSRHRAVDGKCLWNLYGVPRVLYRLPKVLRAGEVFVVEGEKDVHALEGWEFTATTNPLGASKWRDEYFHLSEGQRRHHHSR